MPAACRSGQNGREGMRQLMRDLDQADALADYLAALRLQYKQKRNFIKLLDGLGSTRL